MTDSGLAVVLACLLSIAVPAFAEDINVYR
jgi:hypothetical protein